MQRVLAAEAPGIAPARRDAIAWSICAALEGRRVPWLGHMRERLDREGRRRRIRELRAAGVEYQALARRFKLSERQVVRIVRSEDGDA